MKLAKPTAIAACASALSVLAVAGWPTVASADFRTGVDEPYMSKIEFGPNDWEPLVRPTGSTIVRRFIYWSTVSPTRPANPADPNDAAYFSNPRRGGNWAWTDNVVRIAEASGAEVMLSMYSAPSWAEGPDRPTSGYGKDGTSGPYPGSWKPDPTAAGQFYRAIARRYDGTTPDPLDPTKKLPRIKYYEAWNEPNYQMFLSPQCSKGSMAKGNVCTRGGRLVAPAHYRSMLNAIYDGIKAVQPDAVVGAGSLGPYGNSSQGFEIDPQLFARNLMCLGGTAAKPTVLAASACPTKAKLDALSFHPYTFNGTPTTKAYALDGGALGNAPDFRRAVDLASSRNTVLPAGRKELWETETGWLTCPPCRSTTSATASIGIEPVLAGQYTAEMIYRAWAWGVDKVVWFGLIDTATWPVGLYYQCPAGATTTLADCSSAKLTDSQPKPSFAAFRFPVFAAKISSTKAFAWAMSPCRVPGSKLTFQTRNSRTRAWSNLLTLTLPSGTDGTAKSASWTVPTSANAVRATASGTGCSTETSIEMPIAAK